MSDYAVIVKARMSSERLPGKALVSYCPDGTSNLAQIVLRWQRHSHRQPVVIVATTAQADDDPVEALCNQMGVPCSRGSRDDVATRMNEALWEYAPQARFVARATADNPLVDPELADWRLDMLEESGADGLHYGSYHTAITYAGTTDVWSRAAWDRIVENSSGSQREHVGEYYWSNLSKFSVIQIQPPMREYRSAIRTELDEPDDLEMFRQLWRLWPATDGDVCVPTLWALEKLIERPDLAAINAGVRTKTQSRPLWPKGVSFICERCQERLGGIVAGDLEVRCAHCGTPRKFYANKPRTKPSMMRY